MNTLKTSKGFTLIELLIVIVIIGILAGVLIAVINPGQQQNRARDANVQATINKVALAAEGFNSAYGRAPNGAEFINSIQNSCVAGQTAPNCQTGTATAGCRSSDEFCHFGVSGNALSVDCSSQYGGTGSNQCYFRYERQGGATGTTFRIIAKSFGIVNTLFRYDSALGEIQECDPAQTSCS